MMQIVVPQSLGSIDHIVDIAVGKNPGCEISGTSGNGTEFRTRLVLLDWKYNVRTPSILSELLVE